MPLFEVEPAHVSIRMIVQKPREWVSMIETRQKAAQNSAQIETAELAYLGWLSRRM